MKKIATTLFVVFIIAVASVSQQACSSKPEGAFSEDEKVKQDSTDSTSHASDFEALLLEDSISKDSQHK